MDFVSIYDFALARHANVDRVHPFRALITDCPCEMHEGDSSSVSTLVGFHRFQEGALVQFGELLLPRHHKTRMLLVCHSRRGPKVHLRPTWLRSSIDGSIGEQSLGEGKMCTGSSALHA